MPKNPWSRPEPVTEVRSQDGTESLWEESSPIPWLSPTVFRVHPDHALRTGGGWVVRVHHRTKEADADDLAATTSPSVRDHSVSRDDSCSPEDAPFFHPSRAIEPRSSPANPNGSGPTGPRAHRDGRFCLYCVERPGSALERFVSSSLVSTGSCRPFFRYVLDNREVMRTL